MDREQARHFFSVARQHQAAGRFKDAETLYRKLLDEYPDEPDVLHMLSALSHQAGDHEAALSFAQRAISINPSHAGNLNTLAIIYRSIGKRPEAAATFRQVIAMQPHVPEAHFNLGAILEELRDWAGAIGAYRRAVELRPQFPEALNNLGHSLIEAGRAEDAIRVLQHATTIEPGRAVTHFNLGCVLLHQNRLQEAEKSLRRALSLNPGHAEAFFNLGVALMERNRPAEAAQAYQQALALKPRYGEAAWNLAWAHLTNGDFLQGWRAYESRWSMKDRFFYHDFAEPAWNGQNLNGQRILLHAEQGFGDALQMARFIPMVGDRGGRVAVVCQPQLKSLLATIDGVDQLVALGEPLPGFDVHCPLMSLPGRFDITLQSIPKEVPYLWADPVKVNRWKDVLAAEKRLKVGLVWSGRAHPPHRSIDPQLLAPLIELRDVQFYGLQLQENGSSTLPPHPSMINLAPELHDFSDSAALLMNLDLLITIDTAMAHLAGALARPAWVLLRHNPDWRWLLHRNDSPWYPTLRLFRQQRPRDWGGVVENLVASLRALLMARGST